MTPPHHFFGPCFGAFRFFKATEGFYELGAFKDRTPAGSAGVRFFGWGWVLPVGEFGGAAVD